MPPTNILYLNESNKCGFGRMQNKGTCWFHAILNIFLLSSVGRKMLREQLKLYTKDHTLLNIHNNSNACPMRGTINKQYFWSYVKYKLANIKSGKASRDNLVGENHLIRNLNIRKENESTRGGFVMDIKKFIMTVFPDNDMGIAKITKQGDDINKWKGFGLYSTSGNKVFGAWISLSWLKNNKVLHGHAICGFICNNERYIYDSNSLRSYKVDWIKEPGRVVEYLNRRYGMKNNWQNTKLDYVILFK
jgi:hypothetical protein